MAAKKQKPASSLSLRGLLSWLFGPGRSLPILVALVVVFGGGVWFANNAGVSTPSSIVFTPLTDAVTAWVFGPFLG